jgi:hypothetical protein
MKRSTIVAIYAIACFVLLSAHAVPYLAELLAEFSHIGTAFLSAVPPASTAPVNQKERRRTMRAFNRYRSVLESAADNGKTYRDGLSWYSDAVDEIESAAERIDGVSAHVLAGVVAVLSPLTPWDRNLSVIHSLRDAVAQDYPEEWVFELLSRHTVYNSNARKALRYLRTGDESEISGPKVSAFAENLRGNFDEITIDSWMFRIVNRFELSSASPTDNALRACRRAVRMCATLHGVAPAEAQAIIWVHARRAA